MKRFRIGDLFKSQNGDFDIQQKHINGRETFVVSSGETNSGVIGKSDVEAKVFPAGTITVDMFGYAYYRGHDYKMVTHARVFSLSLKDGQNLSREIGLYFVVQFGFFKKIFSYNDMASWNKIKDIEISLPVTSSGEIDFAYMESYIRELEIARIRELEIARIRELEAYLKVTGLTDYKLTADDRQFLSDYYAGGGGGGG
ncbi:MAG: restriction endonuclease subunit S, partial [Helicobacteraceae bacterium]|nr:restriction endonuclease subunit S [Helicobacteraceae bacterium]